MRRGGFASPEVLGPLFMAGLLSLLVRTLLPAGVSKWWAAAVFAAAFPAIFLSVNRDFFRSKEGDKG